MTGDVQVREALTKRLNELEGREQRLMAALSEAMSADSEEQAVEAEDDEAVLAQENLIVQEIAAVRAAIRRADDGRYGICQTCDEKIAAARLAAVPEATQCISCATQGGGI